MNKFVTLLLLVVYSASSFGQEVSWLPEQAAFKKGTEFYIAQWDEDELLVNDFKSLYVLDRKSMKVKNSYDRKDLFAEKGERYSGVLKTADGWVALGSSCRAMQKKGSDCAFQYARLENGSFGGAKNWMTFPRKGASATLISGVKLEVSDNGKYILRWADGKFIVYNASFEEIYTKEAPDIFTINGKPVYMRTAKRFIDDEGNIYMAGVLMNEKMKRSDPGKYHPFFVRYDRANDRFHHHIVEVKKGTVLFPTGKPDYVLAKNKDSMEGRDAAFVVLDAANSRLTVAGIYGSPNGGGVFSVQYDFANDKVVPLQAHAFPADLYKQVSTDSYKGKEIKGSVILQNVFAKKNGDVMVLLELDRSVIQPQFDPNTPSNSKFDCLDILYFNIGGDNGLEYYGNIPKKQEDAKLMEEVSFVAACVENDVHVVYNTLSKKSAHELMDVKITEDGKLEKKALIGLGKNTTILPNKLSVFMAFAFEHYVDKVQGYRKPIQVSGNEVWVRAMRDKKNSLLKITF